jgi:hypothetical protein
MRTAVSVELHDIKTNTKFCNVLAVRLLTHFLRPEVALSSIGDCPHRKTVAHILPTREATSLF